MVPALINLALVLIARAIYPRRQNLEATTPHSEDAALPGKYWLYLAGAMLIAAGFADSEHRLSPLSNRRGFEKLDSHILCRGHGSEWDRLSRVRAAFRSLQDCFLNRRHPDFCILCALCFPKRILDCAYRSGYVQSIIPAAVAPMVPIERRASAFGLFTAANGISWFVGSVTIGNLCDLSQSATIAICILAHLAALPIFVYLNGNESLRLAKS
jgi:hypothetical protein